MLYPTLPLLALLSLSSSVLSAPTSAGTTFSFAAWVEDIIANPSTALSVEEAIAAKNAAEQANPLLKRVNCRDDLRNANANDAAACLNDLARKGGQGIQCGIGQNQFSIQMCRIGGAQIVSSKATASYQQANCNDVARTGGLIFDHCWRADNTVKGSEICVANNQFQVNILGV